FRIHNYPGDYWRFTPTALELLLEDYPSKILGWHGARNRPAQVWALAFKPGRPAVTAEQFVAYRERLKIYAREPLPWFRPLRWGLARLLCGRGPFAPFLDHNRWETVCGNQAVASWRISHLTCQPRGRELKAF